MRIAAALLLIASCARQTEAPPAEEAASPPLRVYAFDCGRIDVLDLAVFDRGGAYDGRTDSFVDTCYLLRHPKGDLLWDAGMPDAIDAIEGGVTDGPFRITVPTTLQSQLAAIGVAPTDIEYFSISHSHFDHVGNANLFKDATFIVHEAERAHMFRDEARADAETFAGYAALETAKTESFTDERDVFGDGSVKIIALPGHTPGHSVLLARLANTGPLLLSGDLYHLGEARAKKTIPVFNTDAEETLRSMERFEALAAEAGARVIIQHEDEDFATLPKSPGYLD